MFLIDLLFVFAPVMGYIEQYKMIRDTQKVGSFSTDICAILLIANIIRIYYWFATGFGLALLFQAILMICAQLLLLKTCVDANQKQAQLKGHPINEQFDIGNFWRWDKFEHYVRFLVGMSAVLAITTLIFTGIFRSSKYGQLIGYLSLSIQATLGLPQLIKNHQSKSVAGLSITLILSWFLGDLAKTVYFITGGSPIPFIMCGLIQITVDLVIMGQIHMYRKVEGKGEGKGEFQAVSDM